MKVHPLIQKITAAGPVLTDGAWGTQLQARGLAPGDTPDLWNLTHPEKVAEVARDYVAAGSQIILTNTFGANRFRLAEAGAADKVKIINEAGARISREAADSSAFVFASIGPSGKLLMNGDVTEAELLAAFSEQAQALASGGAQGLVVETMQDLDEARIDRKSTRLNSSHLGISYAVFCLKKKQKEQNKTSPASSRVLGDPSVTSAHPH